MNQSTVMSLYIPHVFGNVTKEFMIKTIEFQGFGKVSKIDFVEKMGNNGKTYNSAFVHFEYWCDNIASVHFQERVKNPDKEARIVYKDPWFWACFENTGKKHIPGERKERINLKELKETNNLSNVFEFEEEKNEVVLPQEVEDKFERELLEEFDCEHHYHNDNDNNNVCDLILYQKNEEIPTISNNKKKEINMEYVRHLEMLNYKLIHDLYELRGDFITT
jgi:hypothetical protein